MSSKRFARVDLQNSTLEVLDEHLGLPDVDLESTLDDLGLDSLSFSEFLIELESRLGTGEIELTIRDTRQTVSDFIDTLYSTLIPEGSQEEGGR